LTVRLGEMGKRIHVVMNFNMASNTSLQIIAVPPSGEQNQKTWTATLGGALSSIVLEDGTAISSVASNESMYYDLAARTDIDEVGDWTLVGVYTNTDATPDDVFVSAQTTLTVLSDNYDNGL